MNKEIVLPNLGEGIESAEISEIVIKEGDIVGPDDIILILESEKASMEIPAEVAGKIKEVLVKAGEEVKTGQLLITIDLIDDNSSSGEGSSEKTDKEDDQEVGENDQVSDIVLPDLGEGIESAEISEVVVKEGDIVGPDDIILILESEKASMEIPAEVAGKIKEVLVKAGEEVKTGQLLFRVKQSINELGSSKTTTSVKEPETKTKQKTGQDEINPVFPFPQSSNTSSGNVFASPGVRRLSRELGIDLTNIKGNGPKGRITKDDLHSYIKHKLSVADEGVSPKNTRPEIDFSVWGEVELKKLTKINLITGERLQNAWKAIPHVTQFDSADITELDLFRKSLKKEAEKNNVRITFLPFLMKAAAHVLKEMPAFNSSLDHTGKNLITKNYYHLGVAVDTPQGLTVPVIRDVDKKTIIDLSKELMEISAKAREKKLKPDDLKGGTFTISSLGGIGGTYFTPIINPPEVAILGVSRSKWEPIYNKTKENFIPRLILPFSLSYDHMVIDGAAGATFTSKFSSFIENVKNF